METLLNKIYTDPGSVGSYGGVRHLLEEARKTDKHVSLNDVKNFLLKKRSYTLHKDLRRKFKKLKTTAAGIGTCAQCDLLDLSKFQDSNDGYNFLLVLIDVFSRVINVEPLRNKSAKEVKYGLETVFKRWLYPWAITTDRGDFGSKTLEAFYRQHQIKHYECFTSPQVHCAIVEHAIKQITVKLGRYFTEERTHRWVDVIQKLVFSLNHRFCRTLGMAPCAVTQENSDIIRRRFSDKIFKGKPRFKIGDNVRIEAEKDTFQKGWEPRFTEEVYTVGKTFRNANPPTYLIKDLSGENVQGRFYEQDFSKVLIDKDTEFMIEKILKERVRSGRKEWFVKFLGYSEKFNAWVQAN